MIRFLGTAAALALVASGPALAGDKGNDKGQGKGLKGAEHSQMQHGGDHERGNGQHKMQKAGNDQRGEWREDRGKAARGERTEDRREWRGDRNDDRDDAWARRDGDDRRNANRDGDRWDDGDRRFAAVGWCPPGLAKKDNGCLPPGQAKKRDEQFGWDYRPSLFGIPLTTRADYVYYDGYLVPTAGQRAAYIPLLGGALAVGQLWPAGYPSERLADWQDRYYGFEDQRDYRYVDNVVYRIDPETAAIQSVVALLTGSDFTVGSPLPMGYDVYNVPAAYRDRYYDSDDALYRYADGRIYRVDPTTMLIAEAIEMVL